MAALTDPHAEDVIVRRQSSSTFTIGVGSGTPQIVCRTLAEALERAGSFATKRQVQSWYTGNGRNCEPANLLHRIWNEYIEMPGLRLTSEQAQRLWAIDARTCTAIFQSLIDLEFLVRRPDGQYARLIEGSASILRLRMAKAEATALNPAQDLRPVR